MQLKQNVFIRIYYGVYVKWYTRIAMPVLLALLVVFAIYISGPENYIPIAQVVITFFGAVGTGSVSCLFVGRALNINPLLLIFIVAFMESDMSLFVTLNYDLLATLPYLGKLLKKYENKAGEIIKKRKFIEGLELYTIFILMFIPVYGTGAITMSLVGRLLSLNWKKVWIVISLASLSRTTIIVLILYGLIT